MCIPGMIRNMPIAMKVACTVGEDSLFNGHSESMSDIFLVFDSNK